MKNNLNQQYRRAKAKAPRGAWFVKLRGSYIPVSWQGWLTYLPFLAYLLFVLYYSLATTDGLAQALLVALPNFVASAIVMTYLASRTS